MPVLLPAAVQISYAPYGLEAVLEYGGLRIGDLTATDAYVVTEMSGLDDADIRDSRDVFPDRDGEIIGPMFLGGRTITVSGFIRARNFSQLRLMQSNLKAAMMPGALYAEKRLYFRMANSTLDVYINARKSAPVQMPEKQVGFDSYATRPFLLTFRASDPRFLAVTTKTTTLLRNGTGTTVNAGNWRDYPTIAITGPYTSGGLRVNNTSTGDTLNIASDIPASTTYNANTSAKTFYNLADSSNKYSALNYTSAWPTVEPGTNNWTVADTTDASGAQVVITYRNAWI